MYFDFEDYRPEFSPVGRAISWREGILLSIIVHLVGVVFVLLAPRLLPDGSNAARQRALLLAQQRREQPPRFVFVRPQFDMTAPRPPERAESSDKDRMARATERPPNPTNPLPYSRGNSPEKVEEPPPEPAGGRRSQPEVADGQSSRSAQSAPDRTMLPDSPSALPMPAMQPSAAPKNAGEDYSAGGRRIHEAIQHLDRYIPHNFDNPTGGASQIGPLQFDTKGVQFGPWVRRFVEQVKGNWFVPQAAAFMKGHVVITFFVHKNGSITDITVVEPCPIESFNTAAAGALAASNPTLPLPPEYPSDKAFFTVTFFYNERP